MASTSDKSRGIALMLAVVLGMFGAHRFYVGKTGTGILQICTLGGLGIWYLVDVVTIASGGFRDKQGRRVVRWDPDDVNDLGDVPQEVIEELVNLRQEMNELAERLDFAERLLADPNREGHPR
ncbi:MAG: NINE protein [Gemmatimonadota bacterium]|nr:NINE protein [Gemmatimonadota bacterium]